MDSLFVGSGGEEYRDGQSPIYAPVALAHENPTVAGYLGRNDPLPLNAILLCQKRLHRNPGRSLPMHYPHLAFHASTSNTLVSSTFPPFSLTFRRRVLSSLTRQQSSLVHIHTVNGSFSHTAPPSLEETGVCTILNIVNQMLSTAPTESPLVRMRACFVLHYLVEDDRKLCNAALDRGYLDALRSLILALGLTEPAPPEWEGAEAAATQALHEASFTGLASLALPSDGVRRRILSLPSSLFALRKSALGTPLPNASMQ